MSLVWYWKNSASHSIAQAGLSTSPKTYFFTPISCYHRMRSGFIFGSERQKHMLKNMGMYDELTTALQLISFCPSKDDIANIFHLIELFFVLLYDSISTSSSVNECRKEPFSIKGRLPDGIPPTTDALQLHIYRVIYQASYCWAQSLSKILSLSDPCEWGWKMEAKHYEIAWTSIPKDSKMCNELMNMTKVVKDVVNVFKYLFRVLHSVTVEAIVNVDYFSSLFLVSQKTV